jgi:hypothetical protein
MERVKMVEAKLNRPLSGKEREFLVNELRGRPVPKFGGKSRIRASKAMQVKQCKVNQMYISTDKVSYREKGLPSRHKID